jgi:hypothetical protein
MMIASIRRCLPLPVIALVVGAIAAAAQERPLPDQGAFLEEARARLQTDHSLQRSYAYVETRRERKLDGDGRITEETVRIIESYPGLPGEDRRFERVVAIDGKPVPARDLAAGDRERQEKARQLAARLESQPAREDTRQARDLDRQRTGVSAAVDDIFRVYDVRMLGREPIDGHDTIAFSLTPRPRSDPRTREGRHMRRFAARAWVSESDHELVRVDAEAVETLSIGFGLLARIHKGTRLSFERRKINGEAWLPARSSYAGSARVGLVRTLRRQGVSEFSAYRKFSVDTSADYEIPRQVN